jgi:hypothetical protein
MKSFFLMADLKDIQKSFFASKKSHFAVNGKLITNNSRSYSIRGNDANTTTKKEYFNANR